MKSRKFTFQDQMRFAAISGDHNPLHVDPVAARRMMFGRVVVHGIHALLWALDTWLEQHAGPVQLRTLQASFQAGIGLEEEVVCLLDESDDQHVGIRLVRGDTGVAWIQAQWEHGKQQETRLVPAHTPQHACREVSVDELKVARGSLNLYVDTAKAAEFFPNAVAALSAVRIAELLATTRLIGMECPGLHSIYSGLDLVFSREADGPGALSYSVALYNVPLSFVTLSVQTAGMQGTLKAFLRPPSQRQVCFETVRQQVDPDEFAPQRALIIGGSRGLGEVTAKVIAAGGGEAVLTYHNGEEDARRVVHEIVSGGGRARCIPCDVCNPEQDVTERLDANGMPTHLYYFATPFIFQAKKRHFSPALFQSFTDFYVTGFLKVVQSLRKQDHTLQQIFYPSSVAIDEMPSDMGEYCAAKMAGEVLCDFLEKTMPGLRIIRPRLPRLATDQTVSIVPVKNQDPVPLMLAYIRRLQEVAIA